jgi:tail fiber protein gp32
MQDISAFGIRINLRASVTFPQGITLSQFADDADPIDSPSQQLMDKAMGLNGDLIVWSKANPIAPVIAVIPGSDDDRNLAVLAEANRVGRGKFSARDIITLTAIYPDGRSLTLTQGKLTDAILTDPVSSAGRMKTKSYAFAFENMTRS